MDLVPAWHWRSQPLKNRTGALIFDQLFRRSHAIATLLESPFPSHLEQPCLARYSICAGKPRVVGDKLQLWTPGVGEILPLLRSLTHRPLPSGDYPNLPFVGGWLGWLGYDVAWEIEQLPRLKPDKLPFPVAYWYEPSAVAIADHLEQVLWLGASSLSELDTLERSLQNTYSTIHKDLVPEKLSFVSSQSAYQQAVKKALEYIHAGDIFQANLSVRFQINTETDPWLIYRKLSQINPSPFASYWQTPWGIVISCSPERLIQLQGKQAQTRPIAGTRPRGKTKEEDQKLAQELISTRKEQAEHIMLVDLERNDLGRVCEWGSVEVDELLTIEYYSHVMHLVSNVRGLLAREYDSIDLIRAVFPGGTITGCPKVRCMEIIETLEPVRRSLFYGSCGYLSINGNLDLNILIRTLLYQPQIARISGQVGAGIVADSNPEQEWYESLNKAEAQLMAINYVNS